MSRWLDCGVPLYIVKKQEAYERARRVMVARDAGVKLRVIAAHLGLYPERVRQLEAMARRTKTPPIERYYFHQPPFGDDVRKARRFAKGDAGVILAKLATCNDGRDWIRV